MHVWTHACTRIYTHTYTEWGRVGIGGTSCIGRSDGETSTLQGTQCVYYLELNREVLLHTAEKGGGVCGV